MRSKIWHTTESIKPGDIALGIQAAAGDAAVVINAQDRRIKLLRSRLQAIVDTSLDEHASELRRMARDALEITEEL